MIIIDYPGSARWQHVTTPHKDNIQTLASSLHYLLGQVTQPSKTRLSETRRAIVVLTSSGENTWHAKERAASEVGKV